MKNIGINIRITEADYSLWSNGLRQNIFILAQTFSLLGYNLYIVNTGDKNIPISEKLAWDKQKFKTVHFDDIKDSLDIYVIMGAEIHTHEGFYLKHRGCRIIYYNCGNRYIIEMEEILFKEGKGKRNDESYLDEIWMIPQMMNTNKYYLEIIDRVPVHEIPFVWGPEFIDQSSKDLPNKALYQPGPSPKRVSCFEPNINVFKFVMYDLLIVERAYRLRPDLLHQFYVTNATTIKNRERFISIANKLDIVRTGVASFEGRYQMPYFLSKYTDVVVAHQWENALNYAYLDALYLKYPLVHNAHMVKDAGYYYEGFDAEQGAQQLLYALEHHDKHLDEYEEKSAKVIDRYRFDNPKTLAIYDRMLKQLLATGRTTGMNES